ncbi:MAG: hypothetical protein KatS3mg111_4123 [Pirellulaceae bacterium]|nr:MAG: hypothetical protein KatS3mg111_0461 [Pirellulaceae bacterium]GIX00791.1 MAG: hypothetical protein KatS3mg111_4123 [Pirellulaceae bacterium]
MKDCAHIEPRLSAYYDGELDGESREQVAQHLEACESCREILSGYQKLTRYVAANVPEPSEQSGQAGWLALRSRLQKHPPSPAFGSPASGVSGRPAKLPTSAGRRAVARWLLAAAAAVAMVALSLDYFWDSHDRHELMRREIAWIATHLGSDSLDTYMASKYAGQPVDPEAFERQFGYRPVAFRGLPSGLSMERAYALDMPCCRCIQTICRRPDGSKIVVLEHVDQDHGWLAGSRTMVCRGVECRCSEIDGKLIASFRLDDRAVTIIGSLRPEDIDAMVAAWTEAQQTRS